MNIWTITYSRPGGWARQTKRVHAPDPDTALEIVQRMIPDADTMRVMNLPKKAGARSTASVERAIRAGEAAANW